jgi:hypothetical protein
VLFQQIIESLNCRGVKRARARARCTFREIDIL